MESEKKTVSLLGKNLMQRINAVKKVKKLKDKIFKEVSKNKRYIDRKREAAILKRIEILCGENSASKKDFAAAFELILKMTKKYFED